MRYGGRHDPDNLGWPKQIQTFFDFSCVGVTQSGNFNVEKEFKSACAKPVFVDKLGASPESISNGMPLEDFGHGYPDSNLTSAKNLVDIMYGEIAWVSCPKKSYPRDTTRPNAL
ncbi:hypothetical protein CsSME_00029045 [Camellia sinensis var. sinensis]